MTLKGEAKKDYQRNYMRDYMRRRRANGVKTLVKTLVRPKMGFEPKVRMELDADGNPIYGERT